MNKKELRKALLDAINDNAELKEYIDALPEQVADKVREIAPVDTGEFKESIRHRRTRYRRLSTRKVRTGIVDSTDHNAKVAALEYGSEDTPEFAMFRRAAAQFGDNATSGSESPE